MDKKFFSYKYVKILALNSTLKTFKDTDKLMLHTSNGIYVGKLKEPVKYQKLDFQPNDDFQTVFHKTYLSFLNDGNIPENFEKIAENPLSIELEDVTLITANTRISIPYVELFVDQIIGYSKGSL